jgi:hypothetical protein
MGKITEQNFFKGSSPNSKKIHVEVLNILAIKEMQVKIMIKFHLTPIRMSIIKNTNNNKTNVGEDMGKKEPSYTVGRNIN